MKPAAGCVHFQYAGYSRGNQADLVAIELLVICMRGEAAILEMGHTHSFQFCDHGENRELYRLYNSQTCLMARGSGCH